MNFILICAAQLLLTGAQDEFLRRDRAVKSKRGDYDPKKSFPDKNFNSRWLVNGKAKRAKSWVSLTDGESGSDGAIWSKYAYDIRQWETKLTISVITRKGKLEGDGLAFFCTYNMLDLGSVFGSANTFNGFAVTVDTGQSQETIRIGLLWDGVKLAPSCQVDYDPGEDLNLLIRFYKGAVEVSYADGKFYKVCFSQPVNLRRSHHIGISARTGRNSREKYMVKLSTYDLGAAPKPQTEERDKSSQNDGDEYEDSDSKSGKEDRMSVLPLIVIIFIVVALLIIACIVSALSQGK